jgi:hypothetical protein
MAIPFYGVEAHSAQVIMLDDESVVKDQAVLAGTGGNAYACFVLSTVFDRGLDGGYSRFRRAVQHVHADGAVTVDVTPYRDQQETGSTIQETLATGANPVVTAPMSETGTNFQVKVSLSVFDAAAELGKAQQYVIPRRSAR